MGRNEPMPTTPKLCSCGQQPSLLCLGDRPDKFRNHWIVFCSGCGKNGGVNWLPQGAVLFWQVPSCKEDTPEPWLSELKRAAA